MPSGAPARHRSRRSSRCPRRFARRSSRPSASTPSRIPTSVIADGGLTGEGAPPLSDGRLIESVLMRYPARGTARERHTLCISRAGRLRRRLPVLRDRRARVRRATSRPPRSSTRCATPRGHLAADGQRAHEHRVHGHGRAAAEPRPRPGGRRRRSTIHGGSGWARGTSPSRPPGSCRASGASRRSGRSSRWRSRSMPRGMRCATCSSRSTDAGRPRRSSPRRATTRERPADG